MCFWTRAASAFVLALALVVFPATSQVFAKSKAGARSPVVDRLIEAAHGAAEFLYRSETLTVTPTAGKVTSKFGYRKDPFTKRRRLHKGVDFKADRRTPVYAAAAGKVVAVKRRRGYGRFVIIDHGYGLRTLYAHLRRAHVRRGDLVTAGQQIGQVGSTGRSTGPHLHFEVRRRGKLIDPQRELPLDGPIRRREAGS